MIITPQIIDKLSELAKLEFDASSREMIMDDLKEIISFFEKLNEVDTTGVEPLMHMTTGGNRLRKDQAQQEISAEEALKNAPLHDGSHFKVPKVIKK